MCDHSPPEPAMVVLSRGEDQRPTVWCDPCIAPLVRALNMGGVKTAASCCGHGRRPGNIVLADGRELVIAPDWQSARRVDAALPPVRGDSGDFLSVQVSEG